MVMSMLYDYEGVGREGKVERKDIEIKRLEGQLDGLLEELNGLLEGLGIKVGGVMRATKVGDGISGIRIDLILALRREGEGYKEGGGIIGNKGSSIDDIVEIEVEGDREEYKRVYRYGRDSEEEMESPEREVVEGVKQP